MKNFIELYQNSFSKIPTNEEFLTGAKDIYSILAIAALAKGETWKQEPAVVCHLHEFMPMPANREQNKAFKDYLSEAFIKETGNTWDVQKYVLVMVPTQLLGGRHFVVFEK